MEKLIFNTSLTDDEFTQIETLSRKNREQGLTPDEVAVLEAAHQKSVYIDFMNKPCMFFPIKTEHGFYRAIRIFEESQIRYSCPVILDRSISYLKARLHHSSGMRPTVEGGDIGYFKKVENPERFFIPNDIYLLQVAHDESETWFCRLGQCEDKTKVRIYYDSPDFSDCGQEIPISYFSQFWQLKAINRYVSQSF